jgi:hypothetical protein
MVRFAAGGKVWQNISSADVDDACIKGVQVYNSSPT